MAFDQKTRNLLQRTVTACRRVFDGEFTAQLQELYGIQPDGALTPCTELDHLADEELEVARLLRSRINHLEGGEPSEALTRTQAKPEHVARVIREQAFTVLNRLAALRLCEERGLVLECVRRSVNSEGFQLFLTSAGNALGETHEAYRVYLQCVFDELALDLGVLFDRFSPLALLFPRKKALEDVLRELNGSGKAAASEVIPAEEFAEIWKADETIGWIYQYYNDEAERKKMREDSSAPRNSRELAVRNQFFTPRYVVEFLTDNTLGRLWYEMTRGETALSDRCRYLVRRPTEIFLKSGETAPESPDTDAWAAGSLSQEELLQQPVYIPHRPLKDPREIRLLDPACGSMHFGLYAFDLFTGIYDEAWEIAHRLDDAARTANTFAPFVNFAATFPCKAAFLLEVPRLIIDRNIHGIDIDPRAAQIAGLSLWLRAQRAWHQAGVKPSDRPHITRSNVVCAEPMPGEKGLLREFVEQQFVAGERPAFAFLLEKIFDCMTLAGEAGSLLRIEEEIRAIIVEASALAQRQSAPTQTRLWVGDERPEQPELDLRGLNDEQFWQRAEQRIYDALEAYAEQAENDGGFQRRLFADDASHGFAFIDLCRKRYDAVVMNPPFGEPSLQSREYLYDRFQSSKIDIFAAFVDRGAEIGDSIGAITSRTCFFLAGFSDWRRSFATGNRRIFTLADLADGVLDAMVEAAAYCIIGSSQTYASVFRATDTQEKAGTVLAGCRSLTRGARDYNTFLAEFASFRNIPTEPFAYWLSSQESQLFEKLSGLEPKWGNVIRGPEAPDLFRAARCWWEVDSTTIGKNKHWVWYAKGGEFKRFAHDVHLVVDYEGARTGSCPFRRTGDPVDYFKSGLTFSQRTSKPISFRILPEDCLTSPKGPAVLPRNLDMALPLLGLSNTRLFSGLVNSRVGAAGAAARSYDLDILRRIPLPNPTVRLLDASRTLVQDVLDSGRRENRLDETSPDFLPQSYFSLAEKDLNEIWKEATRQALETQEIYDRARRGIEDLMLESCGVDGLTDPMSLDETIIFRPQKIEIVHDILSQCLGTVFGRWDIRYASGERQAPELPNPFAPLPVCPPGMYLGDNGLPLSPEAGRQLRDEGRYPLDVAWEGILVNDSEHPFDLDRHLNAAIAVLWAERADALEYEACALLGVPTLRDWFRRPAGFFGDHLKRYSKSRRQAPIYWPLSTASGGYTLWLYYHRLTPDTLYKCLQQFVVPKLADVEKELTRLGTILAANEGGARERKRLEELEDLRRELIELRSELELWAPKWEPNLNDGVLITAAPLWKLFRLPKWQKDLKACWQELEKGDYDWAHLAYTLWPDRVREKCQTDRSLAIAHGLEDLCEVKAPVKKARKGKQPKTETDQQELPKD